MELITIEAFADMIVQNNPAIQRRQLILRLHNALSYKKAGVTCTCCGEPIWAAGSALIGSPLCFSCITGEAEAKNYYEIKNSCFSSLKYTTGVYTSALRRQAAKKYRDFQSGFQRLHNKREENR